MITIMYPTGSLPPPSFGLQKEGEGAEILCVVYCWLRMVCCELRGKTERDCELRVSLLLL